MQIVFLFYDEMTALDAIGPHEVLSRLPNAQILRVAKHRGEVTTESARLKLIADYALSEVSHADILLVPGAGTATNLSNHPDILDWIHFIDKTTTWTTSVCTGSLILGNAGLLSGIKATSHWAVLERLPIYGAIPVHDRMVETGKIITAAGVSAGIDMALALAAKIAGQKVAETLQLGIEYDPHPPFNAGSPLKADPDVVDGLRKRLMTIFE